MSLLTCASIASVFYGCQLAEQKRVSNVKQIEPGIYSGTVLGSDDVSYETMINVPHARALSKCNCTHASGRRVVCEHVVALSSPFSTPHTNTPYGTADTLFH